MTTFLVDGSIAIDTGALCRGLELEDQPKIDHIIISHTHLDHISDIGFLADNVIGLRPTPITIHCTEMTEGVLRAHMFNNLVWPDFTRIKIPKTDLPVIQFSRFSADAPFQVGRYLIQAFPMNHPVESMGMLLRWQEADGRTGTVAYSSDTGPTDAFWQAVTNTSDLKAVLCECSFPLELQWLADVSGHLSPKTMAETIQKANLASHIPVLLYHGKPSHLQILRREIRALNDERMTMLRIHDEFDFT